MWGTLFFFVLTMISGARELMTPRAWEQPGATYQLKEYSGDSGDQVQLDERRGALRKLWAAVSPYVVDEQLRKLPPEIDIGQPLWDQPGAIQIPYTLHVLKPNAGPQPFVIEKQIYQDAKQLVLFSDGSIVEYRERGIKAV